MLLDPVKQGQLILSKLGKNLRLVVAAAKLCLHVLNHVRNAGIVGMLVECVEQIQLGVLLDLNADVVKLLDWSITCKEVERSGTEGYDLEVLKACKCTCDRHEVVDHICTVLSISYGILGDVRAKVTKGEIIGCIQHSAVSIAKTCRGNRFIILFCCGAEHHRTIILLCKHGIRDLGTKVAQIYAQGIASLFVDVLKSVLHIDLALDDRHGTFIDIGCVILLSISVNQCLSSSDSQICGEAVTAHAHDADLHFG